MITEQNVDHQNVILEYLYTNTRSNAGLHLASWNLELWRAGAILWQAVYY